MKMRKCEKRNNFKDYTLMFETKLPKEYSRFLYHTLGTQKIPDLRNAEHLRIENEQCHLFEVNSFDHNYDVPPELRTNGHSRNL